jgi:hypothetical protein
VSFVGMSKGCSAIVLRVELSMKRTAWHWWRRNYVPSKCRWQPSRTQHFVARPWEPHISQFYFLDEVPSLGIVLYYILLYYTSPWLMNFFSIWRCLLCRGICCIADWGDCEYFPHVWLITDISHIMKNVICL